MISSDFHIHTNYCHGLGRMDSYVRKAIDKKMAVIGFTSHAPAPFETDWHMEADALDAYLKEISVLKEKYRGRIRIFSGLEVDFIPGIMGPENFRDKGLDFLIGSVHYTGRFKDGTPCGIDNTVVEFQRGLETIFENDIRQLVTAYYDTVISMVENDPPDVIGHLDIIKKLNAGNKYFSEEAPWYRDLISSVVRVIAGTDCVVEINTRGFYQGTMRDFSPGKPVIKKCIEAGIHLTVSSDAHRPDEIGRNFDEVETILSGLGCKQIVVFDGENWRPEQLLPGERKF